MVQFILNDREISTNKSTGMTALDFVRYEQNLTGTKIGCREGDCGACTVLVGDLKEGNLTYESMTSCLMPLGNAQGKHIVTIEGLNLESLNPVQQAILDEGGTQCGFCTVGFAVSLLGFCLSTPKVSYQKAVAAMDGNICRCTGYKSLERAASRIVDALQELDPKNPIQWLVEHGFIPNYFTEIPQRLTRLKSQIKVLVSDNGHETTKVSGGTDLFVQRPEDMAKVKIDHIFDDSQLKSIEIKGDKLVLGGAVTAQQLNDSEAFSHVFPEIGKHMKLVSSTQIRNMGTIGGNFVNASAWLTCYKETTPRPLSISKKPI